MSIATQLTVQFVPDPVPCTFTPYGQGCRPFLVGENVDGGVALHLSGAPPGALAYLILGTRRLSIQLSGTQCFLLTDVVVAPTVFANSQGAAKIVLELPFRPLKFNAQFAAVDLPTQGLTTTNGLAVECQ